MALTSLTFGDVITYYCSTLEEALRRAKAAGKQPGCHYGGITLPGGRRGFAIYKEGKVVAQYSATAARYPARPSSWPEPV